MSFPVRLRIRRLTTPLMPFGQDCCCTICFSSRMKSLLFIRHRLHGCSLAETARREGMSIKRVRHRLKALYRAYFAQEKAKQKEL